MHKYIFAFQKFFLKFKKKFNSLLKFYGAANLISVTRTMNDRAMGTVARGSYDLVNQCALTDCARISASFTAHLKR